MAKLEPKTSATDPTIAPSPPSSEEDVTVPEIVVSSLPTGVVMHETGVLPYTADRANRITADPSQPPPGWKGSFSRCGGCGDFLGNAIRCERCTPPMGPSVVNGGP